MITESLENPEWIDYIKDTWTLFPIYLFYEVNCSKLPWNNKDKLFVFSNVSVSNIEIKFSMLTKFFQIYEVVPENLSHGIVGHIFKVIDNPILKVSYTTHGISVCTPIMTASETKRLEKSIIYDKNEISVYSYGNDAEVITDLAKVMGVVV